MFRVSTLNLQNLPYKSEREIDYSQDFFDNENFLTVSGQLNVEAYCLAMSKVYTFGPTFRAENSNTNRHLTEFWMVEPEIAFADLEDDMQFFQQRIESSVLERLNTVVNSEFIHMDYTDAIHILQTSGQSFEFPVKWGIDLASEHERFLTEQYILMAQLY